MKMADRLKKAEQEIERLKAEVQMLRAERYVPYVPPYQPTYYPPESYQRFVPWKPMWYGGCATPNTTTGGVMCQ